jgi:hypothetical protein
MHNALHWLRVHRWALLLVLGGAVLWTGVHIPAILYGTADTPLHVSYWSADEQSPINGALHILQEKSLLGLKNQNTLYYGPIIAVFAVPAVLADYSIQFLTGHVSGPDAYKNYVVWDWGGILAWARVIATLAGYSALIAVFLLFRTVTINPAHTPWVPYVVASILGSSYLFFEYAGFFRHWIFIVALLLWQLYVAVLIFESLGSCKRLWAIQAVLTTLAFGISYLALVYEVFWLPLIYRWVRTRNRTRYREFVWYMFWSLAGMALMVWWHPYAFIRILGLVGIIEPIAISAALDLAVRADKATSFLFYVRVVCLSLFPLLVLFGVLAVFLKRRLVEAGQGVLVWVLLLPAVANYVVFGDAPLHVVRYAFPTVVLLMLLICVVVSHAVSVLGTHHAAIRVAKGLIGLFIVLNIVQLVGWERMVAAGPAERRIILPQLLAWQTEQPDARTLMVKGWPIGYVHTHAAYQDYIDSYNKASYDLWKYILIIDPPAGVTPINVYYEHAPYVVTLEDQARYDHIVVHHPPATGPSIAVESPEDEFDYSPWHVWQYARYQEHYSVIK